MTRWFAIVGLLIRKEVRLEWRGRELLTLLACNALFMAVLIGAGTSSALLDTATTGKIFPMLLWITFILSTLTSVSRSYEHELEGRAFEGLLLSGVTGSQMYLSKVIVNTTLFFLNFVLLVVVLSIALDQGMVSVWRELVTVGFFSSSALASLVVVIGAIASTSRLRGVLAPLLTLPLLFPLFFAGIEMTTELVLRGSLDIEAVWPSLLLVVNAVYLVLGFNLFDFAIRD
jgi:ABC-type transport system involved in cytochrome c biogenesis permease component